MVGVCRFYQEWYIKGLGFGPRGGASPYKTLYPPGYLQGMDGIWE